MTKRFSAAFIAAALAVALMIAAAAAIPSALFAKEDEALYNSPLDRHREQGALSPEGEDLYLVRTLYARAGQQHGSGYAPKTPERDALRRQLTPALNEMAKSGILPAALSAQLGIITERDDSLTDYSVDSADFIQAVFTGTEGDTVVSFGVEMEPRTGLIVNLWINTAEEVTTAAAGYDTALAIDAYQSWLGLDELDDWQDGGQGYYSCQQTSQKGRMKLYLLAQGKLFHLGAASLYSGETS